MNMYIHGGGAATIHSLKCDPIVFAQLAAGNKKAEVRYDDRAYMVGDKLLMQETRYSNLDMKRHGQPLAYTGREACYIITHIQRGYGLPTDMVVMSVEAI